jgi:hypothetical protein
MVDFFFHAHEALFPVIVAEALGLLGVLSGTGGLWVVRYVNSRHRG